VLSKADSWRTHEGLATWTGRATALLERELPDLAPHEQLLAWTGILRAADFAETYSNDTSAVERLTRALVERLDKGQHGDSATLRLFASEALIEHAGTTGQRDLFEHAVDSVAADVRDRTASPWATGLWLVAFGAISARYFEYKRRGFPYASAEDALRAAVAIGESESLRGVEFGGLYHLQLQMKSRNDFTEFGALIKRLAEIADSRYTTQVAVVADCQAALHTIRRDFPEAHAACDRFMAAIEAANEPPLERWPHFITKFQVLLAEGRAAAAAEFLVELLPLFSGALRQRTNTCVLVARACEAKWRHEPGYPHRLRECVEEIRAANWPAILLNVPDLLAELCGDALDHGIEVEFVGALIERRALVPRGRPARWPWPLRVHVLGAFGIDRNGVPVDFGQKPPSRSLEIVRMLALAKDHTCALSQVYDWLWPDADGDQAKAACEQALHRVRRLLGRADFIVQREGKLRLATDRVWVDLDYWESRLAEVLRSRSDASMSPAGTDAEMERTIAEFPGPLPIGEPAARWSIHAAERVRNAYVEIVIRLGRRLEQRGDPQAACDVYLRAVDTYPTSDSCREALQRARRLIRDMAAARVSDS
jgi:DNA-binding SARP family transcriptional activator